MATITHISLKNIWIEVERSIAIGIPLQFSVFLPKIAAFDLLRQAKNFICKSKRYYGITFSSFGQTLHQALTAFFKH